MNITMGDLVVVRWRDAVAESAWTDINVIRKESTPLVKSVGWFISQDKDCVRILSSISGDEAGYELIPTVLVSDIEKVREDELDVEA